MGKLKYKKDLQKFNEYIKFHEKLQDEIYAVFAKSVPEKRFETAFLNRVAYLLEKKENCTSYADWFESLKHMGQDCEIYSMKFRKFKNEPRILFCIDNNPPMATLLCCFSEANDGYKKGIDKAMERYVEKEKNAKNLNGG